MGRIKADGGSEGDRYVLAVPTLRAQEAERSYKGNGLQSGVQTWLRSPGSVTGCSLAWLGLRPLAGLLSAVPCVCLEAPPLH